MCRSLAVLRHRLPLGGRPLVPAALRSALGTSSSVIVLCGPKILIPVMFYLALPSAGSCCGSWENLSLTGSAPPDSCAPSGTSPLPLQAQGSGLPDWHAPASAARFCSQMSSALRPAPSVRVRDTLPTGIIPAWLLCSSAPSGSVSSLVSFRIQFSYDRFMSQPFPFGHSNLLDKILF